jgi:hypothetical protein
VAQLLRVCHWTGRTCDQRLRVDARDDVEALNKATPLFHDQLKRIEVWCGSRKVGHISPKLNGTSDVKADM